MSRSQKTILAFLSVVACLLAGSVTMYGYTSYQTYAQRPLGPALPQGQFTPLSLPPTWTPTPGDPSMVGLVTLAPTMAIPPTNTPLTVCGGVGVMHVLAVGADSRTDNYQYGLADAIRLVRVDFSNRKITVLEFPRDLWVEIPYIADNLNGQDHEKLNQAYLYGQPGDGFKYWDDPSAGPGLLALTLNLNFGVVTDHYISVNMRTFVNVVNAVDGIDLKVPDQDWADSTGLPIGTHHLNGDQALKVARNRNEGGQARVDNQNLVLCALRKKIVSPSVVPQFPELIESFQDNILTDLTPEQISQFACLGTQLPAGNIRFVSFPQEYFKQDRTYDPVFEKEVFTWDVDFNILRDYVARFQAGTWPEPVTLSTPSPDADEASSELICQ
jgi:LCP family protein required for cell wall assembly